jgi:uncharacterized membrane protein YcjF (UPF0283 family)
VPETKRDWSGWAAFGTLILVILAAMFNIYGEFKTLEYRMDMADQNRTMMQTQEERIERKVDELVSEMERLRAGGKARQ